LQGRSAINALILPASRHYSFDHTMFRHALLLVSKNADYDSRSFINTPFLFLSLSALIYLFVYRLPIAILHFDLD
jgi:hypothetical protein